MEANSLYEATYVILVDEDDHQIGVMEKMEAHHKAVLHRAVSVFIINSNGDWILQRRALDKYHSGGLWTNTCCSHPYPGESAMNAARRRLTEEMGMDCELSEIFKFTYKAQIDNELTEHELDHIFIGYTNDLPEINCSEVSEYKVISYTQLHADVVLNPDAYTVWFLKLFERVGKFVLDHKLDQVNVVL